MISHNYTLNTLTQNSLINTFDTINSVIFAANNYLNGAYNNNE